MPPSVFKYTGKAGSDAAPRVAIVLPAGWLAQELLRGIGRYVRSHRPWQVLLELGNAIEPTPALEGWSGEGFIAKMRGPSLIEWAGSRKVPSVTTPRLSRKDSILFPSVDSEGEAHLAVEHFHSRGLRHFGFCPHGSGLDWGRKEPYIAAVKSLGAECHVYSPSSSFPKHAVWELQLEDLCRWLIALPKPIGVFAANDHRGYELINACRKAGLRVPEDVAVLGDDDDQPVCDLCNPPLSSIQRPHEEMGYRCAALLDALMLKRPIPPQPLLPPVRLIPRQSTDVLAVNDAEVASAIRFIHQNLGQPFNVKDLLREIPIGRRALEQRFHRAMGRTLGREIRRMRVKRATELLIDTQLPMPEIAKRCGFASAPRLTEAFRRELGKTPTAYRRRRT